MRRNKRLRKTVDDEGVETSLFRDIMHGALHTTVDVQSCIPLTKVRRIVRGGVTRLKHIFHQSGYNAGPDNAVLVELKGSLEGEIRTHFSTRGLRGQEMTEMIESKPVWYGIVDGEHTHAALTELSVEYPQRWDGFEWPVQLLQSPSSMNVMRQLARATNDRHNERSYIETTLFDRLYGMRREYDSLCVERGQRKPPSGAEVANAYDGGRHVSTNIRTLQQTAQTAIRLDMAVIEELGDIMNSEHPEIVVKLEGMSISTEEVTAQRDCRIFKKYITLNSLRSSPAFMSDRNTKSQIDTLHRLMNLYIRNGFKSVSKDVSTQYQLALDADRESKKFKTFLGKDSWPQELIPIQKKLFTETIFDEELVENRGNDLHLLPSLLSAYRRRFPQLVEQRLQIFQSSAALNEPQPDTIVPPPIDIEIDETPSTPPSVPTEESTSETTKQMEEPLGIRLLREMSIEAYCMCWYDFDTERIDGRRVDLILTEPPDGIPRTITRCENASILEDKEIDGFVAHAKNILISGGYVVMFTNVFQFMRWYHAFKKHDFKVMNYEAVFVKETETNRNPNEFPLHNSEMALICKAPGDHPTFTPNFSERLNLQCKGSRRRASFGNVPSTINKLLRPNTRSPIRVEEKNVSLLRELISLYSPIGGLVLDSYAGTFTTAIAAMQCHRAAIVVEKDDHCFRLAYDRLQLLAVNHSRQSIPTVTSRKRVFASRPSCDELQSSYVTDEEHSECDPELRLPSSIYSPLDCPPNPED